MHMLERVVANWLLIGDMSFCLFFDRKHFLLVWQKKVAAVGAVGRVSLYNALFHSITHSTPCSKIWNFHREIDFTKFSWNWFQKNLFSKNLLLLHLISTFIALCEAMISSVNFISFTEWFDGVCALKHVNYQCDFFFLLLISFIF